MASTVVKPSVAFEMHPRCLLMMETLNFIVIFSPQDIQPSKITASLPLTVHLRKMLSTTMAVCEAAKYGTTEPSTVSVGGRALQDDLHMGLSRSDAGFWTPAVAPLEFSQGQLSLGLE